MTTGLLSGTIPPNSVLIPVIRQVMPTIIANSIIGVQSMIGPSGSTFMRYRYYPRIKMTAMHYRVFLRLNNRKKSQTVNDFLQAKYPYVPCNFTAFDQDMDCIAWCNQQFGNSGYVFDNGILWFKNDHDCMLFTLRWL